ncbi:MAG: hypothetical protein QXT84_05345 [Candidatus Bathyarchaeia archaeon]
MVSYSNPYQEIINRLVYQVYYRLLGMAPVLTDYGTTVSSAEWVAANIRGGTVSEVVRGRIAQWDGLAIAPDAPSSPLMSLWIIGLAERTTQKRSLLVRKGFWTLYLPDTFKLPTTLQTFSVRPDIATAPFLPRR